MKFWHSLSLICALMLGESFLLSVEPGNIAGFKLLYWVGSPYPTWSVSWCGQTGNPCRYLAGVGGTVESPTTADQIYVYEFDGSSLAFLFSQNFGDVSFLSGDWCKSSCEYFVTGGLQTSPLVIWRFEGTQFNPQGIYPDISLGQTSIYSVEWACVGNDCQYLAGGGFGENTLVVMQFDTSDTFCTIAAQPVVQPDSIVSVAWCCDGSGNHLATGGVGDIFCPGMSTINVYDFTPGNTTLDLISTESTAGIVRSVAWCGDESATCKYLAAGGYGMGETEDASGIAAITILSFDGSKLTALTSQDNPSIVTSLAWCSGGGCRGDDTDCKYLFVTGVDKRVIVYRFDGKALCFITYIDLPLSGLSIKVCDSSEYMAVGLRGEALGNYMRLYSIEYESCIPSFPSFPAPKPTPVPPLPPCCD